jgi:hypothetical protein
MPNGAASDAKRANSSNLDLLSIVDGRRSCQNQALKGISGGGAAASDAGATGGGVRGVRRRWSFWGAEGVQEALKYGKY